MLEYKLLDISTAQEQMDLYNKVFEEKAILKYWNLKHFQNPQAGRPSSIFGCIDTATGKIVGINGFLQMKYQYEDWVFDVFESCDTAIDPNYRHQGIFTGIQLKAAETFKEWGFDAVVGYPNNNSYPGFMKMGWKDLTHTNKLFLPTNTRNMIKHMKGKDFGAWTNIVTDILWHKVRAAARKKTDIQISNEKKVKLSDYEKYVRKDFIRFVPDEKTFAWKMKDLAGNFVIKNAYGDEIGRAIMNDDLYGDGLMRVNIILAGFFPGKEKEFSVALAKILMHIRKKYDLICVWQPIDETAKKIFKGLGFLNNVVTKGGSPFIINVLTEDEEKRNILIGSEKWNPMQIETDTMLCLTDRGK